MTGQSLYSIPRTCGVICGILLLAIIFTLLASLDSVFWISARWGLGALLVATIGVSVWRARSSIASTAEIAQGVAAIVTIVAFVVAARIYFLERRDKAGIVFDIVATRALLPNPSMGSARERPSRNSVLLGIRLLVTNRSSRQIEMKCIALALFRPTRPDPLVRPIRVRPLVRNGSTKEEMQLDRIVETISYDGFTGRRDAHGRLSEADLEALQMRECLGADLFRIWQRRPEILPADARPLFMWGPLRLEPNEIDDRYFEIEIGCEVPFVRVLAKMRIDPFDRDVYEVKAIIPLREICEGHAEGSAKSITSDELPAAESRSNAVPVAPTEPAD